MTTQTNELQVATPSEYQLVMSIRDVIDSGFTKEPCADRGASQVLDQIRAMLAPGTDSAGPGADPFDRDDGAGNPAAFGFSGYGMGLGKADPFRALPHLENPRCRRDGFGLFGSAARRIAAGGDQDVTQLGSAIAFPL